MKEFGEIEQAWLWGFGCGVLFSYINLSQFAIGGVAGFFINKIGLNEIKEYINTYRT